MLRNLGDKPSLALPTVDTQRFHWSWSLLREHSYPQPSQKKLSSLPLPAAFIHPNLGDKPSLAPLPTADTQRVHCSWSVWEKIAIPGPHRRNLAPYIPLPTAFYLTWRLCPMWYSTESLPSSPPILHTFSNSASPLLEVSSRPFFVVDMVYLPPVIPCASFLLAWSKSTLVGVVYSVRKNVAP